jgi:hypothetical protein
MSLMDEMDNLACAKDVIQALPPHLQKELAKHLLVHLNNSDTNIPRPTTPVTASTSASQVTALKRPLNSPESPHRSKKESKVCLVREFR